MTGKKSVTLKKNGYFQRRKFLIGLYGSNIENEMCLNKRSLTMHCKD